MTNLLIFIKILFFDELLNEIFSFFFLINIAIGFRLFIIHRRSQRDIFLRGPCIRQSIPSVGPHFLSVWNHISVPIGQILGILCTNDKYHVLLISYKFRQNRPFSTWVMALVLVKTIIMQNLYWSSHFIKAINYRPWLLSACG